VEIPEAPWRRKRRLKSGDIEKPRCEESCDAGKGTQLGQDISVQSCEESSDMRKGTQLGRDIFPLSDDESSTALLHSDDSQPPTNVKTNPPNGVNGNKTVGTKKAVKYSKVSAPSSSTYPSTIATGGNNDVLSNVSAKFSQSHSDAERPQTNSPPRSANLTSKLQVHPNDDVPLPDNISEDLEPDYGGSKVDHSVGSADVEASASESVYLPSSDESLTSPQTNSPYNRKDPVSSAMTSRLEGLLSAKGIDGESSRTLEMLAWETKNGYEEMHLQEMEETYINIGGGDDTVDEAQRDVWEGMGKEEEGLTQVDRYRQEQLLVRDVDPIGFERSSWPENQPQDFHVQLCSFLARCLLNLSYSLI
jgi:hypothetical protein